MEILEAIAWEVGAADLETALNSVLNEVGLRASEVMVLALQPLSSHWVTVMVV